MQVIYESEDYAVLHINAHPYDKPLINLAEVFAAPVMPVEPQGEPSELRMVRHGFEIVDKRNGREVYLDGSWAELFQENIIRWQRDTPTAEEVEKTIAGYAALAGTPIMMH